MLILIAWQELGRKPSYQCLVTNIMFFICDKVQNRIVCVSKSFSASEIFQDTYKSSAALCTTAAAVPQ